MTDEQHDRAADTAPAGRVTIMKPASEQPGLAAVANINACNLCGAPAAVHWQRRLNAAEVAEAQAREQERRDVLLLLADTQKPPPDLGPLPDCADWTVAVYGCTQHAITQDAASRIHQGTCTAPAPADLPGCNCTPEPAPSPEPAPETPPLPPGWN